MSIRPELPDPFDCRRAHRATGLLATFNDAGVLNAADVHVAQRLAVLGEDDHELVTLAAALAVRSPRESHVCTDLSSIATTATSELDGPVDLGALPWPDPSDWLAALAASPLVGVGDDDPATAPLRLIGPLLYLDRYWRGERAIAADVLARTAGTVPGVDLELLREGLVRLFPPPPTGARDRPDGEVDEVDLQRLASAVAVLRRFTVIAGGPGTGKTTTVGRLLALLLEQGAGDRPLRIALAAPTGKAAARLEEAVHQQAARLDVADHVRAELLSIGASTLHRLLGWRPGSHSRFRHDRANQLPHDVVIVDETSMVSLSMMAKLMEAVRPDARLILVGDPDQLASVEAGAVLGDIVGPAAFGLRVRADTCAAYEDVTGQAVPASEPPGSGALGDGIVVLRRGHRFGTAIAELADAVQRGDEDRVIDGLRAGADGITWLARDAVDPAIWSSVAPVRARVVDAGRAVTEAAARGDGAEALRHLAAMRVLCAHRRGPYGVATWMPYVERWLREAIDGYGAGGRWYTGRPVMVTTNDYGLHLYNGDTGVVVDDHGLTRVVFERRGELVPVSPNRLDGLDTVHAMTIHKSQGSQFTTVAVIVPDETSAILTRELLYTAVTRAQEELIVVGTEAAVRAAIARPVARASGLGARLWG